MGVVCVGVVGARCGVYGCGVWVWWVQGVVCMGVVCVGVVGARCGVYGCGVWCVWVWCVVCG